MWPSIAVTFLLMPISAFTGTGALAQSAGSPQQPSNGTPQPNVSPPAAYPYYAPNHPYQSAPPPNYPYYYYPPPGYPYQQQPPPPPPPQTITANLFSLGAGSIAAEYERAVGSSVSLFAGPNFVYGSATNGATMARMYGVGGGGGLRIFFGGRAPEGGWCSLLGGLFYSSADFGNGDRATATGSAVGVLFGYTWIWGSGFVLSLGGGLAYVDMKLDAQGSSVGFQGTVPALRLALGYAF